LIRSLSTVCAVGLIAHAAAPGCRAAQPGRAVSPEQQERLKAIQAKGTEASLTVFPMALAKADKAEKSVEVVGRDAGKVLAMLLEQAGMKNLEIADSVFVLPADVEFDDAGQKFGEFISANPIKTDYALYVEVVARTGSPPQFDEIRSVIVDKAGECVFVDRQTPADRDFKRIKPSCLMTSCVLAAERVRTQLRIPESARDDSGEGKIARMLAKESPGPDKAEWQAMEQRQAAMKKTARNAKVAVFPVRLSGDKMSEGDAAHLASLLNKKKLCEAMAVGSPLRVEIRAARDEQKLRWDLARGFQDPLKQNPPEAESALLADYMMSRRDGRVRAVHFVVCDRAGEWVIVDFQNDHGEDFQSIDPKTPEDCGRLVAKRLKGYLR
jgi:hypothetical protein